MDWFQWNRELINWLYWKMESELTCYNGTERLNRQVAQRQNGLFIVEQAKWTVHTGTKKVNGLVILEQRDQIMWLYWKQEFKCNSYIEQRG